jgi:hypothetical protein
MDMNLTDRIIGYHYTNPEAYRLMENGDMYDRGLCPIRRFIKESNNLPDEAFKGTIQGLLEPEPESWLNNPEFPALWLYLMHDICLENNVMLLSFQILPTDKAYIVERAHIERELYREMREGRTSTNKEKERAYLKYWKSRVPVFEYKGNYSVPQLTIWSKIEFDRLNIEWIKQTEKVWKKVLDKTELQLSERQ